MTVEKKSYNHREIEKKWQKKWFSGNDFRAEDFSKKPKRYFLIEFPYPSGDGLHTGHLRSHTALDVMARQARLAGYNVLYPIGWDAFGLPTENYALKTKRHPQEITKENIARFKKQLQLMGYSFDWSREINTTDPEYYKWTQWIFLQLFKHGLAYKKKMSINWCLSCKIGLANEEVVGGKCERCGGEVEQREKKQWMLAITKYADRLIEDLEKVDYLEKIKIQQINWIGKSEGALVRFKIKDLGLKNDRESYLEVFTTRPDTLFGCTYMVVAPEHKVIENLKSKIENLDEVEYYIKKAKKKSAIERQAAEKEKTGVEVKGVKAINPVNNQEIPIFVADYVLLDYGTGAIMAVPAHDERDYQFAKKYQLPIQKVIVSNQEIYEGDGICLNSDFLDGLTTKEAKEKITNWLKEKGIGKTETQYHLRDWIFSRQRYWGEPIPLVFCKKCGIVPIPEDQLPVELPEVKNYQPTDTGESPLAAIKDWVETTCPQCGGAARRETDTMPNWAGSSWYFLRYIDPQNSQQLANMEKLKYWLPVDLYNGGMEHTTLHLLYSRFWHKFLFDIDVVSTPEPYAKRRSHGMVLAKDGRKMSKSFDNVINPDNLIKQYGADALRLYEMFMGPFDQAINWNEHGIEGTSRFLKRVWKIYQQVNDNQPSEESKDYFNKLIKKITTDIENMSFNTAVAALMSALNYLEKKKIYSRQLLTIFLQLLSPFAPHICEEIWPINQWPLALTTKYQAEQTIVVQVNGRVRGTVVTKAGVNQQAIENLVNDNSKIQKHLSGKKIRKIIFIAGRLINFVI